MKTEICEKEGHQFRILKYWQAKDKVDISSTGFFPKLDSWYVLMVCLKCGKAIIEEAEENEKEE